MHVRTHTYIHTYARGTRDIMTLLSLLQQRGNPEDDDGTDDGGSELAEEISLKEVGDGIILVIPDIKTRSINDVITWIIDFT